MKHPLPWQENVVMTAMEPGIIIGVHHESVCAGSPCTIHNMTNHRFRSCPQMFDNKTQRMFRVCVNLKFHLDPDEHFGPPEGYVEPECCNVE
jgi:hypothetical protein